MIYNVESPIKAIKAGYNITEIEYFRLNLSQRLSHNNNRCSVIAGEKTIPVLVINHFKI